MKIPVRRLKRALLDIMYKDMATVSRAVKIKDDTNGAARLDYQIIYEDIPCKLSQYKDLSAERNDRAQSISLDFRLTCDPEIIIKEDDVVDVVHKGETFKLVAGTSFNYVTHKEISMRRRQEAKQR